MSEFSRSRSRRYNHIISELESLYHEVALKQGFSDSSHLILYTLLNNDGSSLLADLVTQSGISKQTINSGLRRLEQDGTICLETAGGRAKRVVLTDQGRLLAEQTVGKIIDIENKIFGAWKSEEWALYLQLTERFVTEFKEEIKEI